MSDIFQKKLKLIDKNIKELNSNTLGLKESLELLKETNAKYKILYKCGRAFDDMQDWNGYTVSSWKELNKLLNNIISQEKGYTNGKI